MSLRRIVRDLSWLVREWVPVQAFLAVLDKDFSQDALYAGMWHDAAEDLAEREAEIDVHEPGPCRRFAGYCFECGADYNQACRASRVSASGRGKGPTGVEVAPPVGPTAKNELHDQKWDGLDYWPDTPIPVPNGHPEHPDTELEVLAEILLEAVEGIGKIAPEFLPLHLLAHESVEPQELPVWPADEASELLESWKGEAA